MSGETIVVDGTQFTLEVGTSSLSIASASFGMATTPYDRSVNGANFPDGEFVLKVVLPATTVGTLSLHAQPIDVDGTNDTLGMVAGFAPGFIGNFQLKPSETATQYLVCRGRDLPKLAYYWVYNNATGVAVAANWTLKVTPRSYKAAA